MADYVFVCYARKDQAFTLRLAELLKQRGVPIWIDQWNIPLATNWNRCIDAALRDCHALLVILSPASVTSEQVESEWLAALGAGKLVVPVLYRSCEIPRLLRPLQYADYIGSGPEDEECLGRLLLALGAPPATPPVGPPSERSLPIRKLSRRTATRLLVVGGGAVAAVSIYSAVVQPLLESLTPEVTTAATNVPTNTPTSLLSATITQSPTGTFTPVAPTNVPSSPTSMVLAKVPTLTITPTDEPAPSPLTLNLGDGIMLELVRVPAGEFLMGSTDADPDADSDEKPQHSVYLDEYLIGRYEVTGAQWRAFVVATDYENVGSYGQDDHPVTDVSWEDAVAFCRWASEVTGQNVRLPTEAEWEKAARGSDGRLYPWGNTFDVAKCNSLEGGENSKTPVGQYSPAGDSPYGCADMAGNVWEWCEDWYADDYYGRSARENPLGPEQGELRVLHGVSLLSSRGSARCANRTRVYPNGRSNFIGFRVVVAPPISPSS